MIYIITLLGVLNTLYLTWLHLSQTSCYAITDCSGILVSQYAQVLGYPIALIGCIFFLVIAGLESGGKKRGMTREDTTVWQLSLTGIAWLISGYLTLLQVFWMAGFCLFCLLNFIVVSLLLGGLVWRVKTEKLQLVFWPLPRIKDAIIIALVCVIIPLVGWKLIQSTYHPTSETKIQVIGSIGGHPIRLKDIDKDIKIPIQDLERKKYQLRKQAFEKKIIDYEASQKKQTPEKLLAMNVSQHTPVSDSVVLAFYQQNKETYFKGKSYIEVKASIRNYLQQETYKKQYAQYVERLSKKHQTRFDLKKPDKLKVPKNTIKSAEKGPKKAPITIIEFSDFECPHCSRGHQQLNDILGNPKLKGKIRVIFRHYPLKRHPQAVPAAIAATCALQQGKFWEYGDTLFQNQSKLKDPTYLDTLAKEIGLNMTQFKTCLSKKSTLDSVKMDTEIAQKIGVSATPTYIINGDVYTGGLSLEQVLNYLK